MLSLERKASVSVEAFLLSEDDPRLQSAKDEMSKTGKVKRETDCDLQRSSRKVPQRREAWNVEADPQLDRLDFDTT